MKSQSLKLFCIAMAVTGISPVRVNANGYPFLTLLSKQFEGGAQNIYFSKNQAKEVMEGQLPEELELAKYNVITTTNEAKEERLKLTTSEYTSVDSLFQ